MICYLIRHGKDDETVRGGWSRHPLTTEGIKQAETLAKAFAGNRTIDCIYSSDLPRAMQTAEKIAKEVDLSVIPLPLFRETNNGELAGIKNDIALVRYPGLFWNQMGWEQHYPNGESPKQFYERISTAWADFSQRIISQNKNVVLVTHGGVIHVILSIIEGHKYNNAEKQRPVAHGEIIALAYEHKSWFELEHTL